MDKSTCCAVGLAFAGGIHFVEVILPIAKLACRWAGAAVCLTLFSFFGSGTKTTWIASCDLADCIPIGRIAVERQVITKALTARAMAQAAMRSMRPDTTEVEVEGAFLQAGCALKLLLKVRRHPRLQWRQRQPQDPHLRWSEAQALVA